MSYKPFVWSDDRNFGIPSIDEQHRRLYDLGNEILALHDDAGRDAILSKLNELGDYAFYHFDEEEGILSSCGYPKLEEHKLEHVKYRGHIGGFIASCRASAKTDVDLLAEIKAFAHDWLINHSLSAEVETAAFFRSRQCDQTPMP